MSVRRLAPANVQPKSFAFSANNAAWAKEQVAKYPEGRQASAVIPLLWRAQEQSGGWVPEHAIDHVAAILEMPKIRVLEVATFYTMFNLAPVGRHHVQLCGTVPCALVGAEDLKKVCQRRIGDQHHVTADGAFSWVEVECLGACVNAPMVQINADYYEDLNPEIFTRILDDLAAGRKVKPGPQVDRQFSAPVGGPTTLTDPSIYRAPEPAMAEPASDGGAPIQAATPNAAVQSPFDPAGIASQRAERALDGETTTEKRADVVEAAQKLAKPRKPRATPKKKGPPEQGPQG